MKFGLPLFKLVLAVALCSAGFLGSLTLVAAKPSQPTTTKPSKPTLTPSQRAIPPKKAIRVVLPELPPGFAPGGRRFGGATRGQCPTVAQPLTALVPLTEQPPSVIHVWGLTTEEYPKFWFYLPYTKSSDSSVEFTVLDDESKDSVYTSAIALPEKAGVIGVPLPKSIPPLQVGKRYRWFFNVYCNPQKQSAPIYVEGVILRKHLDQTLTKQLQKAQPLEQVAIYANNGIWHDALTILAELRQRNSQNPTLQAEWKDFLESVGLGDLAAKPLISE